MAFTDSFDQFTNTLRQQLQLGKQVGMDPESVRKRAEDVGDVLARQADPNSPEQRVLKELWQVADGQEQQAIANCMVKLVDKQGQTH